MGGNVVRISPLIALRSQKSRVYEGLPAGNWRTGKDAPGAGGEEYAAEGLGDRAAHIRLQRSQADKERTNQHAKYMYCIFILRYVNI